MKGDTARLISILRQLPSPHCALDLGCGDCRDAAVFCESGWRPGTLTVGLDLDLRVLRQADRRGIHVAQADFTRFPLRTRFNLILIRHPDVVRNEAAWRYAARQLTGWLSDPGRVLITTYSVPEMDTIRGWLVGSTLSPFMLDLAQLTPPGLTGRDRFVMVYLTTSASTPHSPAGTLPARVCHLA